MQRQGCGGYECGMPRSYGNGLILARVPHRFKQQNKPRQDSGACHDQGAASSAPTDSIALTA